MGPLLRNQAVTTTIAAAFSFTLNPDLNTTPPISFQVPMAYTCVCSCPCVQIFCSNHSRGFGNRRVSPKTNNDESKENNRRECFSFVRPYTSHLYRFNRAYKARTKPKSEISEISGNIVLTIRTDIE